MLFFRRLDRSDVDDLFARRVPNPADDERHDAEHNQQDTDELHKHLRPAEMHVTGQTVRLKADTTYERHDEGLR
jgi:hypothetical protein